MDNPLFHIEHLLGKDNAMYFFLHHHSAVGDLLNDETLSTRNVERAVSSTTISVWT